MPWLCRKKRRDTKANGSNEKSYASNSEILFG